MRVGDLAVLKLGEWVQAQELLTENYAVWTRVLILDDCEVKIDSIQEDGWHIASSVSLQLRYKCWSHQMVKK